MSLTQDIVDVAERDGRATVPGLAAMFPQYTYRQVKQGVYNAVFRGLLVQIERGKGLGRGKGSAPAVFGPINKDEEKEMQPYAPRVRRVSSVWELARV